MSSFSLLILIKNGFFGGVVILFYNFALKMIESLYTKQETGFKKNEDLVN